MSELLSSQSKVKYLTAAKEGKYKLLNKTEESRDTEWQRQMSKLQSLQAIVERLQDDYPAHGGQLRNLSISVKSKLVNVSAQQLKV